MSAVASLPADIQVFAAEGFDPQSYANAVINNEPYQPGASPPASKSGPVAGPSSSAIAPPAASGITTTGGDVTAALAKLNFGIEDLNRQIRAEVTTHHPALLNKAASISSLEDALQSVRKGLGDVEASVARLQKKIAEPYEVLDGALGRLERLQRAAELCRRVARFVTLAKRLEGQMQQFEREEDAVAGAGSTETPTKAASSLGKSISSTRQERRERALAEAALTLAELDSVLALDESPQALATAVSDPTVARVASSTSPERTPSIRNLRAIRQHLVSVDASRQVVEEEMESMIGQGLVNLDQALLASSLQTAYNLSVLPSLVASLITDLTEAVTGRIKVAFDVAALAREVSHKETSTTSSFVYKSRSRTEPTNVNLPQWTSALWSRLEALIDDMTGCCVKVYTLEKVLERKKDAVSGASFLDEAMKGDLKERPRIVFWTTLGQVFEKEARQASGSSSFVQQTLTVSYPRLLRLFHDFFARISVHTSTIYNATAQSPETVLLLRAVAPFEAMYLSRSANRMAEAVSSAMNRCTNPGAGVAEGSNVARTLGNELDAARFDPLLSKGVAKKVKEAGTTFVSRIDSGISTDYSSRSMLGPVATPAQLSNAEYANALSHFALRLSKLLTEYPEPTRLVVLPASEAAQLRCQTSIAPLAASIRKELSSILARMHRLDFSKIDPASHGASGYMNELTSKLAFIREEILIRFRLGEEKMQSWVLDIARHLLQVFLIHASIVSPLGEAGKLKLTADMAELEFATAQLGGAAGIESGRMSGLVGDDWRSLRGFRQLLFMEKEGLTNLTSGPAADVPALLVVHHVAVRSRAPGEVGPLKMPHEASGWTQAEYLRWLEEHPTEKDRLGLVEGLLGLQVGGTAQGGWAEMARRVLAEAREHGEDEL